MTELREWLDASAARCRSMRWFGALFRVNVAQDIASDIATHEHEAGQLAYSAETLIQEAGKALSAARSDDSAGGDRITADEQAQIERLLSAAAHKAHDVSERLVIA